VSGALGRSDLSQDRARIDALTDVAEIRQKLWQLTETRGTTFWVAVDLSEAAVH